MKETSKNLSIRLNKRIVKYRISRSRYQSWMKILKVCKIKLEGYKKRYKSYLIKDKMLKISSKILISSTKPLITKNNLAAHLQINLYIL